MRLFKKRKGNETIPLLGLYMIFIMIILMIYISYQECNRIIQRTDDAVSISIQGVCLFDRYEYATGSMEGKEIVCFYPGDNTIHYDTEDAARNMEITKRACAYAYEKYKSVLLSNISASYVIVPTEAAGGIGKYVIKFQMTNVYDGTAYIYDIISGATEIKPATAGMKSILTVKMGMDMEFPIFGIKNIKIEETGKLENRIN